MFSPLPAISPEFRDAMISRSGLMLLSRSRSILSVLLLIQVRSAFASARAGAGHSVYIIESIQQFALQVYAFPWMSMQRPLSWFVAKHMNRTCSLSIIATRFDVATDNLI